MLRGYADNFLAKTIGASVAGLRSKKENRNVQPRAFGKDCEREDGICVHDFRGPEQGCFVYSRSHAWSL